MEQSHLDRKEENHHILIESKGTSTFPSFLSRYVWYLPFYQDVLVTVLAIKMCLFLYFLSRCACYPPFYQDVLVKGREQAHLDRKEGNKHILIERKVTSTSGYKEREQAYLDRKEENKHILIERKGTRTS
jgi:hypothetical protein